MKESDEHSEEFIPKGAIAFFVVLIIAFAIMWSSIYFEILSRG